MCLYVACAINTTDQTRNPIPIYDDTLQHVGVLTVIGINTKVWSCCTNIFILDYNMILSLLF